MGLMRLLLFVLASVLLVVQAPAATKADLAVEALCNDQQRRLNPPAPKVRVTAAAAAGGDARLTKPLYKTLLVLAARGGSIIVLCNHGLIADAQQGCAVC